MSHPALAEQTGIIELLRHAAQQFVRKEESPLSLAELVETVLKTFEATEIIQATAVWIIENSDRVLLAGNGGLTSIGLDGDAHPDCGMGDWLLHVMQQRVCMLQSGKKLETSFEDVLLIPILYQQNSIGAIGLFIPEGTTEGHDQEVADAASHLVSMMSKAMIVPVEQRWAIDPVRAFGEFDQLCRSLHASLSVRSVSRSIVDGCKSFARCDRVSLFLKKGLRWIPKTVSGTETINRRSDQIQRLTKLVRKVTRTRQRFVYDGTEIELGQQVADLTAAYIEIAGAKYLCVIPIFAQSKHEQDQDAKPGTMIGAVVFEYFHQSRAHAMLSRHQDAIVHQVSSALGNSRRYDRIFLRPVFDAVGRVASSVSYTKWTIVVAILACLIGFGWMASTTTVPHYINAEGRLMPVTQRRVFAPEIARVKEVFVDSGQRVEKDQPLIQLEDPQLDSEINRAKEDIAQQTKHLKALEGSLFTISRNGSRFEVIETQAKIEKAKIEIIGFQKELDILEKRKKSLLVRSPIAGMIASFRPKESLQDRPVQRGDQMLEIMDDKGERHLELNLPEQDLGHLSEYMDRLNNSESEEQIIQVNYRFVSAPEQAFSATLKELSTRMAIDESGQHSMLVYATPNVQENHHKIGAVVSAKFDCGPRSLAYSWTINVWRFLQRKLWLDENGWPTF